MNKEVSAEMLLGHLYPELELLWTVRHRGTFYRNYTADVMNLDEEELTIDIARDGLLKLLPPAILTGDFNIDDKNEAYTTITTNKFVLRDAFKVSPSHGGVNYTFQNFSQTPASQCPKIDFIFVTPQIEVIRTGIPANAGNYIISDHNPHWADLQF